MNEGKMAKKVKQLITTDEIYQALTRKLETLRNEFNGLVDLVDADSVIGQLKKLTINNWTLSVQIDVDSAKMWAYTTESGLTAKLFPCSYSKREMDIYDPELILVYPTERRLLIPEFSVTINGTKVRELYESVDNRMEQKIKRSKWRKHDE